MRTNKVVPLAIGIGLVAGVALAQGPTGTPGEARPGKAAAPAACAAIPFGPLPCGHQGEDIFDGKRTSGRCWLVTNGADSKCPAAIYCTTGEATVFKGGSVLPGRTKEICCEGTKEAPLTDAILGCDGPEGRCSGTWQPS